MNEPLHAVRRDAGFTLIELMVVVLIVAVLAAIAIPIYVNQQNQAKDAAMRADLGTAKVAMVSYATDHNGTYLGVSTPGATSTALRAHGYAASPGNTSNVEVKTSGSSFCLQGTSATGTIFKLSASGGVTAGTC